MNTATESEVEKLLLEEGKDGDELRRFLSETDNAISASVGPIDGFRSIRLVMSADKDVVVGEYLQGDRVYSFILSDQGVARKYIGPRMDKKCGKSGIPEGAKCTKPTGAAAAVASPVKPPKPKVPASARVLQALIIGAQLAILVREVYRFKRLVEVNQQYVKSRQQAGQQAGETKRSSPENTWHNTLGVKPNATSDEIKRAYRKKMRDVHPDLNGGKDRGTREVNAAYEAAEKAGKVRRDAMDDAREAKVYIAALLKEKFSKLRSIRTIQLDPRDRMVGTFDDIRGDVYWYVVEEDGRSRYAKMRKKEDSTHLDKKCGKSGIPDDAKCSKPTTGEQVARVGAILGVAALFKLSPVAYKKVQDNYRQGFAKSAELAKKRAEEIESQLEDVPPGAKSVTISVGGFYGYEGEEAARKGEAYFDYKLKNEILGTPESPGGGHHVVSHPNLGFNTSTPVTPYNLGIGHVESTIAHYATLLKPVLLNGRNPEAVELAAKVIAYRKKNPAIAVNLLGHSAGGMITGEAAEILAKAGVQYEPNVTVNLGTGHFGILPRRERVVTLYRDDDLYLKTIPGGVNNGVEIKTGNKKATPESHRVRAYLNDEQVRQRIRGIIRSYE